MNAPLQTMQVSLDQWYPPDAGTNKSGNFVCRDALGQQIRLGCWPDKATQGSPYVGSGQLVTVQVKSREWQGKTYYDIVRFADGGPQPVATVIQQAMPPPPQSPAQPLSAPARPQALPPPTAHVSPPTSATAPAQQHVPQSGPMTPKDYEIMASVLLKAGIETGQLSIANPGDCAQQIHAVICAIDDSRRAYQQGRPYQPGGVAQGLTSIDGGAYPATITQPPNTEAGDPGAGAMNDELPDFC